jgi:hypothetical protein
MFKKALLASILGSTLIAVSPAIQAQAVTKTAASSQGLSEASLVSRYTGLVGTAANAQSLVTGLRNGTTITLVAEGVSPMTVMCSPMGCTNVPGPSAGQVETLINPPKGKEGWGNIDIALALTEAKVGTNPTHQSVKTALDSILGMRASGQGWGKIAKSMDLQLVEMK